MNTFRNADILLPADADMEKWAVVACDQYTSEPEYWKETEKIAGDSPSTYNFILPEIYLEEENVSERIKKIQSSMKEALKNNIFKEYRNSMIYLERVQDDGEVRCGLVGCIDLEDYDYRKGSVSPVRATEATVIERIPPRIAVRRGADIELPHIMILIDDEEGTVIEPLADMKDKLEKVYDFNLMQKGGSVKGWIIPESEQGSIVSALSELGNLEKFNKKYSLNESSPLVYAMGDGNHSLATAKEFYEELKKNNPDKDMTSHPARFALVELVNLHSPALKFEAIHRIVTEADTEDIMAKMTEELGLTEDAEKCEQKFDFVIKGVKKTVGITKPVSKLTVGSLQQFLDKYIKANDCRIDYIHGTEVVDKLSMNERSIGFILPDMAKSELFPTVICDGALPRKTFSMGHAWDKRYYIECRKITL
ncbi:MAG: DUF1015 domain-containing protein [Oscillospiraceae bacterium]|nr:DUF1015 domain-containing protein [Oscillospiraceae bacterium]